MQPTHVDARIAPGAQIEFEVEATFPNTFVTHSLPILADATWTGGRGEWRLGEIAEAIAY